MSILNVGNLGVNKYVSRKHEFSSHHLMQSEAQLKQVLCGSALLSSINSQAGCQMKFTSAQAEALHQLRALLLEKQTNELWGLLETTTAIYCKRTATLA